MPDFDKMYNEVVKSYNELASVYPAWAGHDKLSSGDVESCKDWIEDVGMKQETDLEDQIANWIKEYLGGFIDVGLRVLGFVSTGVPVSPGDLGIDLGNISVNTLAKEVLGDFDVENLKDKISKYSKDMNKSFSKLPFRKKILAMSLIINYMRINIVTEKSYQAIVAGQIDKKLPGVKEWTNRVINRVLFYKTILSNWGSKFSESGEGLPDLQFSFEMSPEQFSKTFILWRMRYPNSEKISGDSYSNREKIEQAYYLHKFFIDELEANRKKTNPQLGNVLSGANVAIGLAALLLGIKK